MGIMIIFVIQFGAYHVNIMAKRTFMTDIKDIYLDKELRTGGFYELSIQVCPSTNNEPIALYTDFIWSQKNVAGPLDKNYNYIPIDIENNLHEGVLHLDKCAIPFITYNVREITSNDTGFNWFDIGFHASTIEKVFGNEYQTWKEHPNVPRELDNYFLTIMKQFYEIFQFQLALIGHEISGEYYLNYLKQREVKSWPCLRCFMDESNFEQIAIENRSFVSKIERIAID